MKERGPPLGSGPHLGEASRSGSKQFPLQRPHQGKHQLSARAGGGVGEGGRGFNFDNRAFKCFHQCCPTCSMWKLCRSLVLWNNKHEHKAWSMKCNHLWQMYSGGKTICIQTEMFQFSFLESRHCNGVALHLQHCSEEQDIQMWHITFPSMYDAHAGLCADLSSWVRSGCSQWAGNCARMTEHFYPDDHPQPVFFGRAGTMLPLC